MYFTMATYSSITLLMILGGTALAQQEAAPPSRTVKDQVLISTDKPAIRLQVDKAFKYLGCQSFILYNVAQAEQHFFVDADDKKQINRLYWVQFEGYLPSNKNTYNYQGKNKANLSKFEFFADANARKSGSASRPDSDTAKFLQFIQGKGYRMADGDFLSQRLLHYIGNPKRDEIMIIYLESMAPQQLTAADLAPNGKAADQWMGIAEKLIERTLQGLKVVE